MMFEVLLFVLKGVLFWGCGCPNSMHTNWMGQPCLVPSYTPPVLASDAEDKTSLIVWKSTSPAPLILSLYFHSR